ncbi:MAG: GHKL domain-containing protein [Clostridia bacterium]|nr:GHKL domain-containing protein [Clostridia bacterium]
MRRKIFLRFFAVTLTATLLMFAFGFLAVKINVEKAMTERLIEETKIVSILLNDDDEFEKFKVYEGNDKFRVTIFDINGDVLLESDTSELLENHKDRPEFQNALNDKPETVRRYSETFGCEMTFYAMKVQLNSGETVVLRLAIRSSEISSYLSFTLPFLIVVLLFSLILSIIISHIISTSISSKFVDIGKSLKTISKGKYVPITADSSEPELYSVLSEINDLNEMTHSYILEMEREHKKLNKVLENISQGIIAINDKNELIFANESASSIFGTSRRFGKSLLEFLDNVELYNKISSRLSESCTFEYKLGGRYLTITLHEVANDDIKISAIIIITDVSGEKLIQNQKSEFFANASHELKTPVTVMQGLSELLLEEKDISSTASKRIERIHKESLRLSSLISDMLKLSKLERGDELELSSININLREVFQDVFDELSEKMATKNISYIINGDAVISSDPQKIREIAENLLSNAVNYNNENGTITVDLSSNENRTVISVSDTGIGIDKKHIPMLCQRFYRVDKSHSKKTGGTGLGLAIVKHICALYGARLEIESELGVGSTFKVIFESNK